MELFQYKFSYHGKGSELFRIRIVNAILCIFTLGLYYPWAKAKTLQYMYSQTAFQEQPFAFTGTGKEMFKGFLKLLAFIAVFYGVLFGCVLSNHPVIGVLFCYAMAFTVIPFAFHGFFKYRMAKTKWQGINFHYDGKLAEIFAIFLKGIFFTIITFGIYGAWLITDLRRYIMSHVKIGDASINYTAEGSDFFLMNLKGYLLTLFTLGIYYFWWKKDQYDFFIAHTNMTKNDKIVILKTNVGGGDFASLIILNFLLIVFTLGLGTAWAITRQMEFYTKFIDVYGDLDFNELQQISSDDYNNAAGDDLAGVLDIGAII